MEEIEVLRRQLERERTARKEAEKITEQKTREIYYANQELHLINDHLEEMVRNRTAELEKARDEAVKANLFKSQFLANMSHELRTPLNAIIGYSEMLLEEADELNMPIFVDDLGKIGKSGKHLLGLINDILDISKIEAGKMDIYYETFNVKDLIHDVTVTINPLFEGTGNVFETNLIDGEMTADETKLRQILINLLSNASKFTKEGTIIFDVYREVKDKRDGYSFRVKDTGIGMTVEQVNKLFVPFTQADSSTTRKYGGTGLGLAISHSFCSIMGGHISVESQPGAGSTFTCWLPSFPSGHEATAEFFAYGDGMQENHQVSVLLIDDEPVNQQLMTKYMEKEGWSLAFANSGQEGLYMAKKLRPKVICLDILMPNMDGWNVLSALKSDPDLHNIPVVIWSITNDKQLGYALGAAEFLTKPVKKERLIEVMDKYISRRKEHSVLVIEDDLTTSELTTRLLQKEGYNVTQARNGKLALQCMANDTPTLILLDLMMPEMNGFQFLEELRKEASYHAIPVIVVTAKSITAEDQMKLNGYVKGIIQKGSSSNQSFISEIQKLVYIT